MQQVTSQHQNRRGSISRRTGANDLSL